VRPGPQGVRLSSKDRALLDEMMRRGHAAVRVLKRARILQLLDLDRRDGAPGQARPQTTPASC